ncbi:unnamed protein product [Phytophthora fragariaefolia]|uniref:Unnamed protein product n=1 Tax=Phytophthora fragariaefolia TaxID=1490495 RepID=A0A9W6TXK2_9STRA|nr:unnamed protein product [Phytophthora fragariaefolia]
MPSEPRRDSKKPLVPGHRVIRSASSDTPEHHGNTAPSRSPKRLHHFWRRKRTVTPTAVRAFTTEERQEPTNGVKTPTVLSFADDDPNDNVIFLNNPTEFDLRSFFFKRHKPALSTDHLERSAISFGSSTSSIRSHTRAFTTPDIPNKGTTSQGANPETMNSPLETFEAKQAEKPRRRFRAKEELCIVLPRSTSRGRTRSQKSWFLGPGFVGRDPGEGTLVVTRDKSMDSIHAEITVASDDYFMRDAESSTGTFLCLSTQYRHYPQRDGFRLRRGDVFRIGPTTSIRVIELQTTTTTAVVRHKQSGAPNSGSTASIPSKPDHYLSMAESSNWQPPKLEGKPNTSTSDNGNPPSALKRMSTVEELRLLAADIEDEFMNEAGRVHSERAFQSDETDSNTTNKESPQESKTSRTLAHNKVHFADTPPVMSDGSVFLGSRYIRPEVKQLHYHEPSQVEDVDDDMVDQLVGSEPDAKTQRYNFLPAINPRPALLRLAIFQHDPSKASSEPAKLRDAREVTLPGQETYLIGSSSACDVRIFPSEGIEVRGIHARIVFDGTSFVLQDISFERDPRRQTRVLLSQRFVKVTRGDWLLLGKCAMYITTVARAFGSERRPDMKEAAMRLDVLRLSKRKPRTRGIFVPVGFRLHSSSGSGASSGSSGWGGSSGGPVTFGKGRDCDAQVFTASLATEQFSVQLERGTCLLTPKPTGINAGTYFLIGRDESRQPVVRFTNASEENAAETDVVDVVKHTSKPLLLSEGCVFRCGGCELEVIYSKNAATIQSTAAQEEQENARILSAMPWLQQIASDWKTITNLARCGQRLQLASGHMVYKKRDPANFVFIVISGEVALQMSDGFDHADSSEMLVEHVATGGYFGEVSLHDPNEFVDDLEHVESAKVSSPCVLLALARDDVCGYLELYMDIVRAHLRHDRCRDRIIRVACRSIPWLRGLSLQEMRLLSGDAEVAVYGAGSTLFEDGKLFVPAAFAGGSTLQLRDGLLVLSSGKVRIIRSKRERQRRRTVKVYEEEYEDEQCDPNSIQDVDEETETEPDEWWSSTDPVLAMSSTSSPSVLSFCDLSFRLEACSEVECYFVAAAHLAHLTIGVPRKPELGPSHGPETPTVTQLPPPLKRGNSQVGRRMHHSQVVTSALHGGDSSSGDEDDHNPLDGSDGEGDTTGARRWRRKKRNKHLLEQTVLETQNDVQMPNALVLYVLGGAQRGDIHVVRNVAFIGGLLSGADIELNDRYVSQAHAIIEYHDGRYWLYDNGSKWGTFVRLEEDNAVDINPGNVFLAGEIEFTCLASYPERNKPSMCCIM